MERVAIPWLHIIREHPVFLENYRYLFESSRGVHAALRNLYRMFRNRAGWFNQLLRSCREDGRPWSGPEELPHRIDVLFISHLLNATQAGQSPDFYFGNLPGELAERGHSVAIALINHTGLAAGPLAEQWRDHRVPRIVLSGSLRFSEEMDLRRRLRRESLQLRQLARTAAHGFDSRILAFSSEEAISGGSLTALRMAVQIGSLAAEMQPKTLVVTHEGHSWERLAFAAARKAVPGIKCIGYQHAALFRLQHAIRRNLSSEYNPDHIVTAGAVAKAQLDNAKGLNGLPTSVLGSNRALNGIRSRRRTENADQTSSRAYHACLVLPEGIPSECHLLFEFSLECARSCPEIAFIWRLHPILSFKSLAATNKKLRSLPHNIILSQATLEEDMSQCSWALYRGTTAVVQAVVAGLRPLYLQLPEELTVDPLYELEVWRKSLKAVEEFRHIVRSARPMRSPEEESSYREAERYCREFFTSLNPRAIELLLS